MDVRVPKARSRSGSQEPFRSSLVPPYVRRSASVDAAVPWLYLHGVSTGSLLARLFLEHDRIRTENADVPTVLERRRGEESDDV